jgi:aromatic ring-cleaving dioxygenase
VLVHTNTGDEYRDHTQRASWLGTPWPVNLRGWWGKRKEEEEKREEKQGEANEMGK